MTEVKDWPRSASMDYPDARGEPPPTHLDVPAGMTDDSATQDRIFAALTNSADHPNVRRIDTHAASVFLEGRRALKIKRAVQFPFLDYSTLEKRKAACEEEIRINRPLAPQIYHRVVAITEEPDGSIEGRRKRPADRVCGRDVALRRKPDAGSSGQGRPAGCKVRLGRRRRDRGFACAGCSRRRQRMGFLHPRADRWQQQWPADRQSFRSRRDRTTRQRLARMFLRLRPLLEERGRQGFVRRCHGDLHLANIVSIDAAAGAVRRHRVRRPDGNHRRALRSRIRIDGPVAPRSAARGQYRAEPLSRRDSGRKSRRALRTAAVHVHPGGDPRPGRAGTAEAAAFR